MVHKPSILALLRKRQEALYEFEAGQVYIPSSRPARTTYILRIFKKKGGGSLLPSVSFQSHQRDAASHRTLELLKN